MDVPRAEKLAAFFPGAVAMEAEQLMRNPTVDAIAILTPPQTHGPLLAAALGFGKHVFVEKPLTVNAQEATELVTQAAGSDRVVAVGHNLRFHRLVQRARSLVQSGKLGNLLAVTAMWTARRVEQPGWRSLPSMGGGVLLDLGVHHADLLAYLAGSPMEDITAVRTGNARDGESATMAGRFRNGALFSSLVSQRGVDEHVIHVAGDECAVEFSLQRANSWRTLSKGQLGLRAQVAEVRQYVGQLPDVLSTIRTGGDWAQSYVDQWRAFASVVGGGETAICSLKEAATAVNLCSMAAESCSIAL